MEKKKKPEFYQGAWEVQIQIDAIFQIHFVFQFKKRCVNFKKNMNLCTLKHQLMIVPKSVSPVYPKVKS